MEQREAGNAYSVLEHIDVMLLVEGELFVDSLEEVYDIAIVISHEKVAHRLPSGCRARRPGSERNRHPIFPRSSVD